MGLHDRRRRKSGPSWGWVAVLRCHTHRASFSAYPPGHCPYGRVPLVALAPDGSELRLERGADRLAGTLLAASVDAARGERWPRQGAPAPPDAVRSTQRRRVGGLASLLGLVTLAANRVALEVVAQAAEVPAGLLLASARGFAQARDLEHRGREVESALERLLQRPGSWLSDRLAVLGFLAGCWGRPYRWSLPAGGRLLGLGCPFWASAQAGKTAGHSRDGP